jgi:hypothetical protein
MTDQKNPTNADVRFPARFEHGIYVGDIGVYVPGDGPIDPPPVEPPSDADTYTIGAGDTKCRLPAPSAEATTTINALAAAGGQINGPAVIRGGAWSSGQITISGSDVVLADITFTAQTTDVIRITGHAKNVRIHRCRFEGAGGSLDASNYGIIKIDPHPDVTDNAQSQRVPINRQVTIDENTVTDPKDCFVWMNHGNRGIRISHNTILGTAWRNDGHETEILKFGWNDGNTDTGAENVLAFNSIPEYEGRPYTIGWKQSDWLVVGNQISRRVEFRSADRIRFIGNVIEDGDLHGGQVGHLYKNNYVRTIRDHDGFGPVTVYATNGFSVYDDQPEGTAFYYTEVDSCWEGNTLVNDSPGFGVILFHSQYGDATERPHDNLFVDNLLVTRSTSQNGAGVGLRMNNDWDFPIQQAIDQNEWAGNRMYGVTTGQIPGETLASDPGTPVPLTVVLDAGDLP